jgi:initiation factor 1A
MVEEEGEIYAQVSKDFGNGMCEVICNDNVKRLCIIRGKYRGRGKRDNSIKVKSIIMVGLRDWETHFENSKKLEKCDLLEVYSDYDVDRLKKSADITWSIFDMDDNANQYATDDIVHFSDNTEDEYKQLLEKEINTTTNSNSNAKTNTINEDIISYEIEEETINFDDI